MALATAPDTRSLALLKAVGFDRLAPEQRELALHIAERYELDVMLKHIVMIEGRPYITRDGLLHVAHRSGQLDGIEVTDAKIIDGFWRSTCSVWRKDMSRPFTYTGRYPTAGGNQRFAPEMAVKVGEVMALRRAFDVSAPVVEERWDVEVPQAEEVPKPATLAQTVASRRAAVVTAPEPVAEAVEGEVVAETPVPAPVAPSPAPTCGDEDASPMALGYCAKAGGHAGAHGNQHGTWPAPRSK